MKQMNCLVFVLVFISIGYTQVNYKIAESSADRASTYKKTNIPPSGKEVIPKLHKGTMIIRLPNAQEKLEYIKAHEGEAKALLEKKRIDQANKALIQEFEKDYHFSDVVYSYDNLFQSLNSRV